MSYGLAAAEWLAACICAALGPSFRVRDRANFVGKMQVQALMRDPLNEEVRTLAVTDAKSLYDNLVKEAASQAEKRAGLEICVCREALDELNGQARRFRHDQNPTDCLTKLGGNSAKLFELLRTNRLCLQNAEQVLADRKEYRETTGKQNPRPSRSGLDDDFSDHETEDQLFLHWHPFR